MTWYAKLFATYHEGRVRMLRRLIVKHAPVDPTYAELLGPELRKHAQLAVEWRGRVEKCQKGNRKS